MDKLSYEEVIEELVIEADALEKDLEEANVMLEAWDKDLEEAYERIDSLELEVDGWKRLTKILHKLYREEVVINKAKQDELDFQSEQLEELLSEEFMPLSLGDLDDLGDFDDEATIEFVSLDDLVGTEDELYDPFLADRYS